MGLPETDGEKVLRAIGVYFSPENQLLISSSTAKKDDVSKMTLASIYAGTLKYEQFLEKIREKKLNLSKDHLSFREEASNMTESVKEFV